MQLEFNLDSWFENFKKNHLNHSLHAPMQHAKSLVNEAVKEKGKRSPKRKRRLLRCFAKSRSYRARVQREAHDQAHVQREARLISQENSLTECEEASREDWHVSTSLKSRSAGCRTSSMRAKPHAADHYYTTGSRFLTFIPIIVRSGTNNGINLGSKS
jgi:sensor c-di-GMP phosphodiesterase-like protein